YMATLFVRQTFGPDSGRVTLTFGKLSVTDTFDNNKYSHDPRAQFMNWGLMANPAWDYPADTRGYTWGTAAEWAWDAWSWRAGGFLEPEEANGPHLESDITRANGEVTELEHDHQLAGHSGAVRILAFWNQADMGHYQSALVLSPVDPDITQTRSSRARKYGFGLNTEQELATDLGGFLRLGWNDGHTETWAFDEVDRTASVGLSLQGRHWSRPDDVVGLALLINGLSRDHRDYLAA